MSSRGGSEDGSGRGDIRKPLLNTGNWYRMSSWRLSSMGMGSSAQVIRERSVSVLFCVLVVALGPIQFGFTVILPDFPFLWISLSLSLSLIRWIITCQSK